MKDLELLSKDQLLQFAKHHQIFIKSNISKSDLMVLIYQHSILNRNTISNNTKHDIPISNISITYDNTITILLQSENIILLIWHSDPQQDPQLKAWQLTNDKGLDILLPNYARSLFLDISLFDILNFSLYKVYFDNRKELFNTYYNSTITSNNTKILCKQEKDKLMIDHFTQYNTSIQHFSSSNNFCK